MKCRIFLPAVLLACAAGGLRADPVASAPAPEVPYPEDFRSWRHVASAVTAAPMGETGGKTGTEKNPAAHGLIHNLYANDRALEGYRTGKFPEGAMLVADWYFLEETKGGLKQGPRKSVDVMVRDVRHTETGGWGFENFDQSSRTQRNVGPKAATSCFACHQRAGPEREFVFSTLLP